MSIFSVTQSVGEIVSIMPKASDVFKRYNIDFCCGGHRELSEVLKEQKINEQVLLKELDEAYEETNKLKSDKNNMDFRKMSHKNLIDYIVEIHHAFVKETLPEIGDLSSKILKVHGSKHSDLFKVHKLFNILRTELEQHLIKEEEILFPMIKEYEDKPTSELLSKIKSVMKETEDEHETAGGVLKELRQITDNYTVPKDGCSTYSRTYDKLQELESDLFQHIHLENNIMFKKLGI